MARPSGRCGSWSSCSGSSARGGSTTWCSAAARCATCTRRCTPSTCQSADRARVTLPMPTPSPTTTTPATTQALRAPRAAAIAGILFSLLLLASIALMRVSVPNDPHEAGAWLATRADTVELAMNLVPLAGIAFLWFIGVLRDRLGAHEDRLFATVFLGSGLLFLALLFVSAATAGGFVVAFAANPQFALATPTFTLARALVYEATNIYAVKMAGVFMFVSSTLALRTRFLARWIALLGYALALSLVLVSSRSFEWILAVFPLWVLLTSLYILYDNLRAAHLPAPAR